MHQTATAEDDAVEAPSPEREEAPVDRSTARRVMGSWFGTACLAIALAIGLRTFIAETYVIPSESMVPTLQVADHILVEKELIDVNGINPGDLVVFDRPAALDASVPENLIKRVIAVGGDRVESHDGSVWVNGTQLAEPYAASPTVSFAAVDVPAGQLFVMGDNRGNSADSRVFGPIPESSVIGTALARIWPPTRIGTAG